MVTRSPELLAIALEISEMATRVEATIHRRPIDVDIDLEMVGRLRAAGAEQLARLVKEPDWPDTWKVNLDAMLSAAGL